MPPNPESETKGPQKTNEVIYEEVERPADATVGPSSVNFPVLTQHDSSTHDENASQEHQIRSKPTFPITARDETTNHPSTSGYFLGARQLQPQDGVPKSAETKLEAPSMSFIDLRTKFHAVHNSSPGFPGAFGSFGLLNASAFSRPQVPHTVEEGRNVLSSLIDTRLRSQDPSDSTTVSTKAGDADLRLGLTASRESAPNNFVPKVQQPIRVHTYVNIQSPSDVTATDQSALDISPSEAQQPTATRTRVNNDLTAEHAAAQDSDLNSASRPAKSTDTIKKYRPGAFANPDVLHVGSRPDNALNAQKDAKSNEQATSSAADLSPDYVIQSAFTQVRKAFGTAIAQVRDDVNTAMNSLRSDFDKKLAEIEKNAQHQKKDAWNSGQRTREWKGEGLEKRVRDLEEQLKDTQARLEAKDEELKEAYEALIAMD